MQDILCVGDFICLFCEDTKGFIYSDRTSTPGGGGLFVGQNDDKEQPEISTVHAIVFQIVTQNRYKLSKKYRRLVEKYGEAYVHKEPEHARLIKAAKAAADAEVQDNLTEQARLKGKGLQYGEVVQLRHAFTNKFVHTSTTETSSVDKSKMVVGLENFNAKNAQFKISPTCKVKVEGEMVEYMDEIVLESIKSGGNFLHASDPFNIDHFHVGSELNLGSEKSSFTIMKHYRPSPDTDSCLRGGSLIRLFHKEIEAYMVAEGLFQEEPTENVHLRIREITTADPRTMYPPKSGITFWQMEIAKSNMSGEVIRWDTPVRIRHMPTRRYLAINTNYEMAMVADGCDPTTIFSLQAVTKIPDDEQAISLTHNVRIRHVLTEAWLHASEEYQRRSVAKDDMSLNTIRWDGAKLIKLIGSQSRQYQDAFTIQKVEQSQVDNFNNVAGIVPFIQDLTAKRLNGEILTSKQAAGVCHILRDLKKFVMKDGKPLKERQKLMRNLQLVDALVALLKCPLVEDTADWAQVSQVYRTAYEILHGYTLGKSKKNALYFAKYIEFFISQLLIKGGVGLQCCKMLIELIRDNRKIVNRIRATHLDLILGVLGQHQHFLFLELLAVLCVCDNIAITENQTRIAKALVGDLRDVMYHLELGQDVMKTKDIIYVSTNNRTSWGELHKFEFKSNPDYSEDKYTYLLRQLDLYKMLAYGRNDTAIEIVTRTREFFTWEVAFTGLSSEVVPDKMRARFCDLIIGLFVDVGDNSSIIAVSSNNFVYSETSTDPNAQGMTDRIPHDFESHFPAMRVWLNQFFDENRSLVYSQPLKSLLMKEVLRLVTHLVQYGFMGAGEELRTIMDQVNRLVDGLNDVPFPPGSGTEYSDAEMHEVTHYRKFERYKESPETQALISAKLQGLSLVDLLLVKEFNIRIRYFVAQFKYIEQRELLKKNKKKYLGKLLYPEYQAEQIWKDDKMQSKLKKMIKKMMAETSVFDDRLPTILFDLTNYKDQDLLTKSLSILDSFYSGKRNLFTTTTRSQVLTTVESVRVHRDALKYMASLRRLMRSKLDQNSSHQMETMLLTFAELCHLSRTPETPHLMGQNILVNNGILEVVTEIISQEVDQTFQDQFDISSRVYAASLSLIRFLAQGNRDVQDYLFDRLDILLQVQICGVELAYALNEIFRGRADFCMKIQPSQVQMVTKLIGRYMDKAPQFLDFLRTLTKDEASGVDLRRNQLLVAKAIMAAPKVVLQDMEGDKKHRLHILVDKEGEGRREYLLNMINLLATCAEGGVAYVESFCQTLLSADEIINLLNNRHISIRHKKPLARYLVAAYFTSGRTTIESGIDHLPHDASMWKHIKVIWSLMKKMMTWGGSANITSTPFPTPMKSRDSLYMEDGEPDLDGIKDYLFKAGFKLLESFMERIYTPDTETYPEEPVTLRAMLITFIKFADHVGEKIENVKDLQSMLEGLEMMLRKLSLSKMVTDKYNTTQTLTNLTKYVASVRKKSKLTLKYDSDEVELNKKLKNFSTNCLAFLEGQNLAYSQMGLRKESNKILDKEYVGEDMEPKVPLGEEFQQHVECFFSIKSQSYKKACILIDQLEISAKRYRLSASREQMKLDIKSLQIIRTSLYNLIIKVPDDWKENNNPQIRMLIKQIKKLQTVYSEYDIIKKTMPLLARNNDDLGLEILSLLGMLLFNANVNTQTAVYHYFTNTAEEMFFMFVRSRFQLALLSIKERRSIESQKKAREKNRQKGSKEPKEEIVQKKTANWLKNQKLFEKMAKKKRSLKPMLRRMKANMLLITNGQNNAEEEQEMDYGFTNLAFDGEDDVSKEDEFLAMPTDTSSTEVDLILQVIAGLCDGQNRNLQDYLRLQPDNVTSINLTMEVTQFLLTIYTHIDGGNIDLIGQILSTLNELCVGNQENRAVILNNKIVDAINFIMRMSTFEDCTAEQVVNLKNEMVVLLTALMEENDPEAFTVAKEIVDTLDVRAIRKFVAVCYKINIDPMADLDQDICGQEAGDEEIQSVGCCGGKRKVIDPLMKETVNDLGFSYTLLLLRMIDIDPKLAKQRIDSREEKEALQYYKADCMSVEIIKDDCLQRVNFRVRNQSLLREEIREQVKWDIDRSSPTAKHRDLVMWARDILKDIDYQKSILGNPILRSLAAKWAVWNYACILLSLAINCMMLVTWHSPMTIDEVADNATVLPAKIYQTKPVIHVGWYYSALYVIGGVHNFCSLMLFFSYMLLKHPTMPDFYGFLMTINDCLGPGASAKKDKDKDEMNASSTQDEEDVHVKEDRTSNMEVKFFSGVTVYYTIFFAFSMAGTFYHGYFFAFHLLNIVANNQLLKGVIKAVTMNGPSLLWVGVMGLIVIYLYALIGFAFMRPMFSSADQVYCDTLAECTMTVVRYGVIGDITDALVLNDLENTFAHFSWLTLYQITFFILFTTIGLNVIFGIIVDTFSELRDLKWTAEKDMRDTCFICARDSYDFEQTGKGFLHHVKNEHNMWAYVFYFTYLREIEQTDYTALDMYVSNLLKEDKYDFFPLNRAMSLSTLNEDQDDKMMDDMMQVINDIRKAQQKEVQARLASEESMMRRHLRFAYFQNGDGDYGDGPGGPGGPGGGPGGPGGGPGGGFGPGGGYGPGSGFGPGGDPSPIVGVGPWIGGDPGLSRMDTPGNNTQAHLNAVSEQLVKYARVRTNTDASARKMSSGRASPGGAPLRLRVQDAVDPNSPWSYTPGVVTPAVPPSRRQPATVSASSSLSSEYQAQKKVPLPQPSRPQPSDSGSSDGGSAQYPVVVITNPASGNLDESIA